MKDCLAIVIPAYKIDYFEETMQSIANQTNHDFNVYIGIDASPYDFESIINKYVDKVKIEYKRFDNNLGGKDLVAQWERCVEMTKNEEWIWLFSDDDIMLPHCVEDFYKTLESPQNKEKNCQLFHFNVNIIDGNSLVIKKSKKYSSQISSFDFYNQKMRNKIDSYVVENIFSRKSYREQGGFVKFDCAWGADTASWIAFMGNYPMQTIDGDSIVLWRQSDLNISPDNSCDLVLRKVRAIISFLEWSTNFFSQYKSIKYYNLIYVIQRLSYYGKYISMDELRDNSKTFLVKHYPFVGLIYLVIYIISFFKRKAWL